MCGIVGAVLKYKRGFDKRSEDSFFEMLYTDALRGWDSTGVVAVEHDGRFHIAKEACEATYFVPQIRDGAIGRDMFRDGKAYIGHNRKRTVGKVEDETAHPFVVDDTFAMVHNGTLYNHEKLAKTDVDSEALAMVLKEALGKEDYKTAIEDTLGQVFGAYAVAIYDQKTHKIHLVRNKDRPLTIVEAEDAYYFASEGLMAGWILSRNGYNYTNLKAIPVDPDVLVTFDLGTGKMTQETLVPKKSTPHSSQSGHASGADTKCIGNLSKNELKRFRKNFLGKRISFWVDDFVEANYPLTVSKDNETKIKMWGVCEEMKIAHSIDSDVDISPFGFNQDESEITDRRWTGMVEAMEYNEPTGLVYVSVVDAKPLVRSVAKNNDHTHETLRKIVDFNREIEAWSDGYLVNYLTQKKDTLTSWQISSINMELNARNKAQTYHESSTSLH